jgi:hypothetical protein
MDYRNMGRAFFYILVLLFLISISTWLVFVRQVKDETQGGGNLSTRKKEIKSKDGSFLLKVPALWREESRLDAAAQLQAANRLSQQFVIVIKEPREDVRKSALEKRSMLARELFKKKLNSPEDEFYRSLTVDGYPAVQYKIRGIVRGTFAAYLQTTVEAEKHYYQIYCWTVRLRFDKYLPLFEEITASFVEPDSEKREPLPSAIP